VIYGIGTDIVQIDRVERIYRRFGQRFAEWMLHPREWQDFNQAKGKGRFLAKRFAVKEAASKAFGTGIAKGLSLQDIVLTHNRQGKPKLVFYGQAAKWVKQQQITASHVSLSDEKTMLVAFVLLETGYNNPNN
jgi:holo-[acyl-carrier protein] synthase